MDASLIKQLYAVYQRHPLISTDTRTLAPNSIFFALKGDKFNANQFAEQAIEKGCAYAVIDEKKFQKDERFILVPDVLTALQQLANYHRRQLRIPFIGITGSNGKTTTKELIAAVLSTKYKTAYTKGNLNNHIGVPLTLLSITAEHEMAIIEMGANHVGEIKQLCEIAEPDFGMITNIGKAHLEGFGGPEGVIKGKSELYQHIRKHNGRLFVNNDNELLRTLSTNSTRTFYGKTSDADIIGELTATQPFITLRWKKNDDSAPLSVKEEIKTHLVGGYNFENILAAIAIGIHFNVSAEKIKEGIESYVPGNSRSQAITKGTNTIIMDAYNANPTSMRAALENFSVIKSDHKLLVLGDMLELGTDSEKEHQAIADYIHVTEGLKNAQVILVGQHFSKINNVINALLFSTSIEVSSWVKNNKPENTTILIKGSRGVKLETVLETM